MSWRDVSASPAIDRFQALKSMNDVM